MKQISLYLLLLAPLALVFNSCAQTKVYAYAQPVVGGVNPQGAIHESGEKEIPKLKSRTNHYFFISHSKSKNLEPVAITLNGKTWKVNYRTVDSNEVYITDVQFPATPEKIILVPQTNKQILSLQIDYDNPLDQLPITLNDKFFEPSEIIFFYKRGDKIKYKALDKFTMLKPVATM